MRHRLIRRGLTPVLVGLVVAAVGPSAALAASGGPRAARSGGTVAFSGNAYGTYAFLGDTLISGKSALTGLGACTFDVGVHHQNTVASISAPAALTTGAISTTADSLSQPNGAKTVADVHSANLLSGLITATEVRAVSATTQTAQGFATSSGGSAFVGLVVAGQSISGTPGPNTTIDLAGIGKVVLNEQSGGVTGTSASLTVNMIHVYVTQTNPLVQTGTEIIVAHASTGLKTLAAVATLDGHAYGSTAQVGNTVLSGRSAVALLPCLGTNGKVKTNDVAGVSVPPLLSSGTITDTAQGSVSASLASSETTSTVQGANLLSALVTADVVRADAHATSDGTASFSDSGSTFTNLVVTGHAEIDDSVGPNTKVKLTGIGTLWLHRVVQTPESIEVRMIELIVTQANPLGIQVGTDIRVAVAEASVH